MAKLSPLDIQALKNQRKVTCLTAYTAPMAQLVGRHVDMILVGDSLGMVVHGLENTLGVTLEMMALHGRAVTRGLASAGLETFVIVDMPYGSYEEDAIKALENARWLIAQTGADAVKLEGGVDMAPVVRALTAQGIAVQGHIGLQPQSVEKEGGYKIKGHSESELERLVADAKAIAQAGAFSIVVEGTVPAAAEAIVSAVSVPIIGIGASPACDGQVLVVDDMLGLHDGRVPKFVRKFADLAPQIDAAVQAYVHDVQASVFPAAEHVYKRKAS